MSRDNIFARKIARLTDVQHGLVYPRDAEDLLRREHAAITRAVKRLRDKYLSKRKFSEDTKTRLAYHIACEDVLALLATRKGRKG